MDKLPSNWDKCLLKDLHDLKDEIKGARSQLKKHLFVADLTAISINKDLAVAIIAKHISEAGLKIDIAYQNVQNIYWYYLPEKYENYSGTELSNEIGLMLRNLQKELGKFTKGSFIDREIFLVKYVIEGEYDSTENEFDKLCQRICRKDIKINGYKFRPVVAEIRAFALDRRGTEGLITKNFYITE